MCVDGGNHSRGAEARPLEGEHRGPDGELTFRHTCLPTPMGLRGDASAPQSCVIVNTISDTMNLNHGAVSKAILMAAGRGLQAAVLREAKVDQLDPGSLVVTEAFNLTCQKVFHTICPPWSASGQAEKVGCC